jgi:hypothetical protein
VALTGVPMLLVGEEVLRRAHSLAEAEAVLRRYRPAALWTFVLTDLKAGQAEAVESSRDHFSVRPMESHNLVQTNHLLDPALQSLDEASVGIKMNSIYRRKKAFETLDRAPGHGASVAAIASILAYQHDPQGELEADRDVLKAHTIQTVILTAHGGQAGQVLLSEDKAPAASGRYASFAFPDLFRFPAGPLDFSEADPTHTPPAKRRHQREIAKAFHAYFDQKDLSKALHLLQGHHTLDADLFRAVARYQQGFFLDAYSLAGAALSDPRFLTEPAYLRQSLGWVKLASLLQLGQEKKDEARRLAEHLKEEQPADGRLKDLVRRVATGQPPLSSELRLKFEFFSGDLSGSMH